MPIYEGGQYDYEQLNNLRKYNVCAECGGRLDLYQNWGDTRAFIACADWARTGHEGIVRESSRWEKEGMASLNIESRRKIMEQGHGTGVTTAMEKARLPMTGALTKLQAMDILKLVYPKAPEEEIIRCAMLCRDFGLHPLMKEVYLIPFKDKGDKDNYVTVLGICATRKLMSQRGSYSYLDNTPRIMTEKEQMTIWGEVDASNIRAITKFRTAAGLEAQGYGSWPRNKEPYGTDKGNSKANMAFIRSERNAFGRLFTDALPQGVEVVDEAYVEVPDVGKVSKVTGEITEGEVTELKEEAALIKDGLDYTADHMEHFCQEHNCDYEKKVRGSSVWYAHKLEDGKWCNEIKSKNGKASATKATKTPEPTPEPEPESAPAPEPEPTKPVRDSSTLKTINELFKACNEDWGMQPADVIKELGVKSQSDISDTPADCYRKIAAVR